MDGSRAREGSDGRIRVGRRGRWKNRALKHHRQTRVHRIFRSDARENAFLGRTLDFFRGRVLHTMDQLERASIVQSGCKLDLAWTNSGYSYQLSPSLSIRSQAARIFSTRPDHLQKGAYDPARRTLAVHASLCRVRGSPISKYQLAWHWRPKGAYHSKSGRGRERSAVRRSYPWRLKGGSILAKVPRAHQWLMAWILLAPYLWNSCNCSLIRLSLVLHYYSQEFKTQLTAHYFLTQMKVMVDFQASKLNNLGDLSFYLHRSFQSQLFRRIVQLHPTRLVGVSRTNGKRTHSILDLLEPFLIYYYNCQ